MQRLFGKQKKENQDLVETILLEQYNTYYRLAYSYVHNEADACDIVQNGAYKALRSCHTLKHPEYAQTWIYRIMLNECFSFLKHAKPYSYEEMEEEGFQDQAYAEDRYENIDLKRAINQLEKKDKAVVILRFFEDRKLEEIAEILDENLSTVKSRLYRSLRKMRAALEDEREQSIEPGRKVGE